MNQKRKSDIAAVKLAEIASAEITFEKMLSVQVSKWVCYFGWFTKYKL